MQICLFARPNLAPGGSIDGYLELARLADTAGLHALCFGEHQVIADDTARYPYGRWVHTPETAWFDPMTTLAAVAAVTQRIRLSSGVLLIALRAGVDAAKAIATLDVISHGRVELGVGTGWQREEYDALGISWRDRFSRFDQTIDNCRRAWGSQPFSVTVGERTVDGLRAYPQPTQVRIPILYGVRASATNAARIARWGDGWMPVGLDATRLREGKELIERVWLQAGRPREQLIVRCGLPPQHDTSQRLDVSETFARAGELVDAGATQLSVSFNHRLESVEHAADLVGAVADAAARLG